MIYLNKVIMRQWIIHLFNKYFLSLYPEKYTWTSIGECWVVGLDGLEGKQTKLAKEAGDSGSG